MSTSVIKKTPSIIDSLSSNSTVDALSANQGKDLFSKLGESFTVKAQLSGNFPGLVGHLQLWLVFAQRASVNTSAVLLVHRHNDKMLVREIMKDSSMSYVTNSVGTLVISYSGTADNILACAIRLY